MKNLLNYQTTEYDCGPVSILNGVRYLFEREEIYPDLVKFIMLYCMDQYNENGEICKHGTSPAAVQYMSNWLNHFSEVKHFPLHCDYFKGEEVFLAPGTPVWTALEQGAAVVVRLSLDCWHYVLLTGLDGTDRVLLFDPYYEETDDPNLDEAYKTEEILFLDDMPKRANRSVSIERLNRFALDYYQMGGYENREALVMYHVR